MRALWLRSSVKNPITTLTPMKLLHGFFALKCWYPQRQTLNLSITLADPRTFIVRDPSSAIDYRLAPITSRLHTTYAIFLSSLREKWISSIERLNLRRCLQLPKTTHTILQKQQQELRISNPLQFGDGNYEYL